MFIVEDMQPHKFSTMAEIQKFIVANAKEYPCSFYIYVHNLEIGEEEKVNWDNVERDVLAGKRVRVAIRYYKDEETLMGGPCFDIYTEEAWMQQRKETQASFKRYWDNIDNNRRVS